MPQGDGTGPAGQGQRSDQGQGPCNRKTPSNQPCRGGRPGRGSGQGRRRGGGCGQGQGQGRGRGQNQNPNK